MAIAKKYKRNIVCKQKNYVWYVCPNEDNQDWLVLHILSEDKTLILACPIGNSVSYVISQGCKFQGNRESGVWKRYLYPGKIPDSVTPSIVSEIIDWAISGDAATEILYNGIEIWL